MMTTTKFRILGVLKGLYFYLPIFTLYVTDHHIAMSVVVFSQVFYSIAKFLGEMPTGVLADMVGQKVSIIIGYLLEGMGIATVVLFPTVVGLYVCYALGGFAASFLSGSEEALLFEACKTEKKKYVKEYGAFLSNQTFGMVVSAFIGGVAFALLDRVAFIPLLVATVTALFCAAILATSIADFARAKNRNAVEGKKIFSVIGRSMTLLRTNSTLFHLTIIGMLTITGDYFLYSVYQPAFQSANVPALWFGAALSIGSIVNMVLTRYVYLLERYFTLEKIILTVNVTIALGYLGMAVTQSPVMMVVAFLVAQSLFGLEDPVVSDYVNERTDSEIRSTVLSGMSFVQRFANVFLRAGLAFVVGAWGVNASLGIQGGYLFVGAWLSFWLLIRCGCTHRVKTHDGVLIAKL